MSFVGCGEEALSRDLPGDGDAAGGRPEVTPDGGVEPARCTPGRSLVDRPDDAPGDQVHLIYVVAKDGVDEDLDTSGAVEASSAAWDTWMTRQMGQGRRLRLDRCDGQLDVSFFRLARVDAEIAATGARAVDEIQRELVIAGFDNPSKTYAIYYGGSNSEACGSAGLGSRFGAIYLRGDCEGRLAGPGEEPAYAEFGMLHEVLHAQGVVSDCAPNNVLGHVSDDPRDLMYAGPLPWAPSVLDVNNDDYFGHGRPECFDYAQSTFIDPLPPNPQRPPGWTEIHACSGSPLPDVVSGQCSSAATAATTVTVRNGCAGKLASIFWVDDGCAELPYGVVLPGTSLDVSTYVGHVWRIRDERTGELLVDSFAATEGPLMIEVP